MHHQTDNDWQGTQLLFTHQNHVFGIGTNKVTSGCGLNLLQPVSHAPAKHSFALLTIEKKNK